jgi:hypothetical protein
MLKVTIYFRHGTEISFERETLTTRRDLSNALTTISATGCKNFPDYIRLDDVVLITQQDI